MILCLTLLEVVIAIPQEKQDGNMRTRIKFRIDIQEFIQRSNAEYERKKEIRREEYERKRKVFGDAIQVIIKEKKVPYNEAKKLLTAKLSFDIMRRRMQMVS